MTEEWIPGPPVRDATWFTRRARNAMRRPLLIAVGGGLVFVLTLIVLLVIPRRGDNSAKRITALASERRDTTELLISQGRRSEERRVGKECGAREWQDRGEKKGSVC